MDLDDDRDEGQDPDDGGQDDGQRDDPPGEGGQGDQSGGDGQQTYPASVVQRLRRENAATRKRLQEAQQRAKELEDKDKSELDKLRDEVKRLQGELTTGQRRAREADVMSLAVELGARKPRIVARLVDDDVPEEDLEKALKAIKKENPELFGAGAPGGGGDGGGGQGQGNQRPDMNQWIRKSAGFS